MREGGISERCVQEAQYRDWVICFKNRHNFSHFIDSKMFQQSVFDYVNACVVDILLDS